MPFETPITARLAIENVLNGRYVLPSIQREFIWEPEQIEMLVDSLLRGYPISSFLFWQVAATQSTKWQFYKFLTAYHELKTKHNEPEILGENRDFLAILDGQQRLTALVIGLTGSYASKLPNKRRSNLSAYPVKRLYVDLLNPADEEDGEKGYAIRFLTDAQADNAEGRLWVSFPDLFKKIRKVNDVLMFMAQEKISSATSEKREFAASLLARICECINTEPVVNYFLERDADLDKVLTIFIRINSGGAKLSYSDLLLSIATASWKTADARKEIHGFVDELNSYSDELTVDKDFVLKSCLVLTDIGDIKFKVINFTAENVALIEQHWNSIKKALSISIQLIKSFGLNDRSLLSANAVIPIAYYLLRKNADDTFLTGRSSDEDRKAIKKWLSIVLLRGTFGSMADTILAALRGAIAESPSTVFPVEAINTRLAALNRAAKFSDEEIDNLLEMTYGDRQTFLILSLLYPTFDYSNGFHVDHVYPRSKMVQRRLERQGLTTEDAKKAAALRDDLANLQLLQGGPNKSKSDSDFDTWLNEQFKTPTERGYFLAMHHFPPMATFGYTQFSDFIDSRRELLRAKLREAIA